MELEGIICGEGYEEAPGKVVWERIAVVVQKQGVVAQWRHGNAHLGEVVEVLHCGHLDMTEQSDMDSNYRHQNKFNSLTTDDMHPSSNISFPLSTNRH